MVLPLSALLSHALVAYTVEFDNEFEHRMRHTTTVDRTRRGPWLVSLAMWANCMRFVASGDLSVRELAEQARTSTNVDGMRRWGYVELSGPRSNPVLRATAAGRRAARVWEPLGDLVEQRWRERSGTAVVDRLRAALAGVAGKLDAGLPDCMPILRYGLRNAVSPTGSPAGDVTGLPLWALLSRVLVGFAAEFEDRSRRSLAIGADVLRLLDTDGVRVRDLPASSGVSKESIAMALGVLEKASAVEIDSVRRSRVVRLTAEGVSLREAFDRHVGTVEARWRERFDVSELRAALTALGGETGLLAGMRPYPDGWRADVRPPEVLPQFPMVLHRGGYPDGS
ncbi:MAG TPA: hypothetical protein VHF06_23260 [Pseudonocardiaceae bacterium]|nr:hypothetical protein [Pseudonocardiaceae bacterium]